MRTGGRRPAVPLAPPTEGGGSARPPRFARTKRRQAPSSLPRTKQRHHLQPPTPGAMRTGGRRPAVPLAPSTEGSGSARPPPLARTKRRHPSHLPERSNVTTYNHPPPGPCALAGADPPCPWPLLPKAAAAPALPHLQERSDAKPLPRARTKQRQPPQPPTPGAMRTGGRRPAVPLAPPTEGGGSARPPPLARTQRCQAPPPARTKQRQPYPSPRRDPCAYHQRMHRPGPYS